MGGMTLLQMSCMSTTLQDMFPLTINQMAGVFLLFARAYLRNFCDTLRLLLDKKACFAAYLQTLLPFQICAQHVLKLRCVHVAG